MCALLFFLCKSIEHQTTQIILIFNILLMNRLLTKELWNLFLGKSFSSAFRTMSKSTLLLPFTEGNERVTEVMPLETLLILCNTLKF